jgi:hypothetical protein
MYVAIPVLLLLKRGCGTRKLRVDGACSGPSRPAASETSIDDLNEGGKVSLDALAR